MKNIKAPIKKCYQIFYFACIAAGAIIIADCLFNLQLPKILILAGVLVFETALFFTQQKNLRIPVFGGIAVIAILIGAVMLWYNKNLTQYFYLLKILCICFAAAALSYAAYKILWLKISYIIIETASLIYFSIKGYAMPKWAVCIVLLCLIILAAELTETLNSKTHKNNYLYLIPIFAAVMLPLLILPSKETPIQWTAIKKAANAIGEKFNALIVDAKYLFSDTHMFSISSMGYGANGKLQGDNAFSDDAVILLTGTKTCSATYLTGSAYNNYTGQNWQQNIGNVPYTQDEYIMQQSGIHSAFEQSIYSNAEIQQFTHFCAFKVEYKGLKTQSLFLSGNTYSVALPKKTNSKVQNNNTILTKPQGVGFNYYLYFDEIDWKNENVQNILRQKAWKSTPILTKEAQQRQDFIYQNYTKLPSDLPQRIYSLSHKITQNEQNDYDKLKAIERYLQQFTYTTTPGDIPKDRDFVDYFLFDGQKGYCTYFASAMAVMARCEGIPTKYVEGFVTDQTRKKDNQAITLQGNDAHAWVEAYIDNIGWVTFDPTPGYHDLNASVWKTNNLSANSASVNLYPQNIPKPLETEAQTVKEQTPQQRWETVKKVLIAMAQAAATLVIILAVLVLIVLLRNYFRKKAFAKKTDYQKTEYFLKKLLIIGKLYGFEKSDAETLQAYSIRLDGVLDINSITFEKVCRTFEAIRFGNKKITSQDVQLLQTAANEAEKQYLRICKFYKKVAYVLH